MNNTTKTKNNLLKNTLIFTIGNFSTKILSFILVPLYSYYLRPEDYGSIDIVLTIVSLLYVLVSLQTVETVFRFIQDKVSEDEKRSTFTSAFFTACISMIAYVFIMVIINAVHPAQYAFFYGSSCHKQYFLQLCSAGCQGNRKS